MDVAMQIYSAKRFLVLRDYKTSLEKCEEGLEILQNEQVERISGLDDEGGVEKAQIAFGVLALQGLTLDGRENEMDAFAAKWFGWSRSFPSEILQICACHHLQMQESQVALDLVEDWLSEEHNHSSSGLDKVAELYIRHILLPMKEVEKAETFVDEFKLGISIENKKDLVIYIEKKKKELSKPMTDRYEDTDEMHQSISSQSTSSSDEATKKVSSKGPVVGLFFKVFKFFKFVKQMVVNNASMKTGLTSCARLVVLVFFLYIIFLRTYLPGVHSKEIRVLALLVGTAHRTFPDFTKMIMKQWFQVLETGLDSLIFQGQPLTA